MWRLAALALLIILPACTVDGSIAPSRDDQLDGDGGIDGIVFVHGFTGSSDNWSVMVDRFKADGWPDDRLIVNTFSDPEWGCNTLNAGQLAGWVAELKAHGATRVAVVAHSMGGLSSRYFMKGLDGTNQVAVFITLGTMHHGLSGPCYSPVPVCVWRELCSSGSFIRELNSAPTTPGPTKWISIFSDGDETVPTSSSELEGATNILVPGLTHAGPTGLQDSSVVYELVRDSLKSP